MFKKFPFYLGLLCSSPSLFFIFSSIIDFSFTNFLFFYQKERFLILEIYLLYRRRSSPPLSRLLTRSFERSFERSRLRSVERFLLRSFSRSRSLSRSFSRFSRSFLRKRSRSSSILFCSSIFR